ncbi:MAG: MerR family transcriptional regulator [Desulfobulbaceae bacterium]|nr:MAG: MerR family transcriptional regulator [Desulfobulbaceae bacterium]
MFSDDKPIFTIGVAAKMLEVHPRTLRIYEKEGLIRPIRKGKWRYFTMDDIKWVECLRSMIHEQGISIAAIKKLLQYTPCWNVAECSFEKRKQCTAFMSSGLVPRKIEVERPRKIANSDGKVA